MTIGLAAEPATLDFTRTDGAAISEALLVNVYEGFDGTWPDFDAAYQPIPYVKEPYCGDSPMDAWLRWRTERRRGGMVEAIRDNGPQRISSAQAADVVEIISTMHQSFRDGAGWRSPRRSHRRHRLSGQNGGGPNPPGVDDRHSETAPHPSRLKGGRPPAVSGEGSDYRRNRERGGGNNRGARHSQGDRPSAGAEHRADLHHHHPGGRARPGVGRSLP
jgi:hypothetical protein